MKTHVNGFSEVVLLVGGAILMGVLVPKIIEIIYWDSIYTKDYVLIVLFIFTTLGLLGVIGGTVLLVRGCLLDTLKNKKIK